MIPKLHKRKRRKVYPVEVFETAIALYKQGLSCRQIAAISPLSASSVATLVQSCGISRNRIEAVRKRCEAKEKSTHWRSARCRARRVWKAYNGTIPDGFHIHHKDGDYTNNNISNLELLSPSAHAKLHRPTNPVPRWLRPKRQEYQRHYLKTYVRKK